MEQQLVRVTLKSGQSSETVLPDTPLLVTASSTLDALKEAVSKHLGNTPSPEELVLARQVGGGLMQVVDSPFLPSTYYVEREENVEIELSNSQDHTLRALPEYVMDKTDCWIDDLDRACREGHEVFILGILREHFNDWSTSMKWTTTTLNNKRTLARRKKSVTLVGNKTSVEKFFNSERPEGYWMTTENGKSVYCLIVVPGRDYILHTAELVHFRMQMICATKNVSYRFKRLFHVYIFPSACSAVMQLMNWSDFRGANNVNNAFVVLGYSERICSYALARGWMVSQDANDTLYSPKESDFFASRVLIEPKTKTRVMFLSMRHTFWGDISYYLARALVSRGALGILYAAKLGTFVRPDDIENALCFPCAYWHLNSRSGKFSRAANIPNCLFKYEKAAYQSGNHISVPTLMSETRSALLEPLRKLHLSTIDNEVANIANGVDEENQRGGKKALFGAVSYATDYLHVTEDLSVTRTSQNQLTTKKAKWMQELQANCVIYWVETKSALPLTTRVVFHPGEKIDELAPDNLDGLPAVSLDVVLANSLEHDVVFVIGEPGSGKSHLLKRFAELPSFELIDFCNPAVLGLLESEKLLEELKARASYGKAFFMFDHLERALAYSQTFLHSDDASNFLRNLLKGESFGVFVFTLSTEFDVSLFCGVKLLLFGAKVNNLDHELREAVENIRVSNMRDIVKLSEWRDEEYPKSFIELYTYNIPPQSFRLAQIDELNDEDAKKLPHEALESVQVLGKSVWRWKDRRQKEILLALSVLQNDNFLSSLPPKTTCAFWDTVLTQVFMTPSQWEENVLQGFLIHYWEEGFSAVLQSCSYPPEEDMMKSALYKLQGCKRMMGALSLAQFLSQRKSISKAMELLESNISNCVCLGPLCSQVYFVYILRLAELEVEMGSSFKYCSKLRVLNVPSKYAIDRCVLLSRERKQRGDLVHAELYIQYTLLQFDLEDKIRAKILFELGGILSDRGLIREASRLLQEALKLVEKGLAFFSPVVRQTPEYASFLQRKAVILEKQGNLQQALKTNMYVKLIFDNTLGPGCPQSSSVVHNIARIWKDLGEISKAKDLFCLALELKEKLYGKNSFRLAKTLASLASVYFLQGKHCRSNSDLEKALQLRQQARQIYFDSVGEMSHSYGSILHDIGDVHRVLGRLQRSNSESHFQLALSHLFNALQIKRLTVGPRSKQYAASLNSIGLVLLAFVRNNLAIPGTIVEKLSRDVPSLLLEGGTPHILFVIEQVFLTSLRLRKDIGERYFASSLHDLGDFYVFCCVKQQNICRNLSVSLDKAEKCLKVSLSLRKKIFGKDSLKYADSLRVLARCLKKKGHKTAASDCAQKAKVIFSRVFPNYSSANSTKLCDSGTMASH